MHPLISIIIPCLNRSKFLPHAVSCALSQTYENIECIIVDDGSTDNTPEVVKVLQQTDSRIKYAVNTGKHGPSGVRNFGIKQAKGEWIQFYDVDDHLYPQKIRSQIDFLTKNNINIDQDLVLYSDFEVKWQDVDGKIMRTISNDVKSHSNDELINKIMSWTEGPTMPLHVNSTLFKRSIFNEKIFNENLFMFEEHELFIDLLYKKIPFIYIPTLAMTYIIHDSNLTKDYRRSRMGYIQFLWEVYKKEPDLLQPTSARINIIIKQAMKEKDIVMIEKIISLVKRTETPFQYQWKGFIINKPFLLKLIFFRRKPLQLIKSILIRPT